LQTRDTVATQHGQTCIFDWDFGIFREHFRQENMYIGIHNMEPTHPPFSHRGYPEGSNPYQVWYSDTNFQAHSRLL